MLSQSQEACSMSNDVTSNSLNLNDEKETSEDIRDILERYQIKFRFLNFSKLKLVIDDHFHYM